MPVRAHPAAGGATAGAGDGAAAGGTVEPADGDGDGDGLGIGFGGRSALVVDVAVATASLPTTGTGANPDPEGSVDTFVAIGAGVVAEPSGDAVGMTAPARPGSVVTTSDPDGADGPEVDDTGLTAGAPHATSTTVIVRGTTRRTLVDSLTNEAYKFKSGRGRGGTWSSSLGRNYRIGFSSRAR